MLPKPPYVVVLINMTMFNISTLRGFEVLCPPLNLLEEFDQLITPLISLKKNLEETNIQLQTLRDLQLPKLISGELDVRELDIVEVE